MTNLREIDGGLIPFTLPTRERQYRIGGKIQFEMNVKYLRSIYSF